MTKGQQIAFAVYGDKDHELGRAIDAAIAEATEAVAKCTAAATTILMEEKLAYAVEKRTVECAGICTTKHFASDAARDILALNAPPAPVYPFGKDATGRQCACWEQNDRLWWNKDGDYPHDLDAHFTHCPFCGAPRTKGN
jgi:hypothetical protein